MKRQIGMEKRHHVSPILLDRARAMRHESAPAEQRLWACLRNRQLNGFKFRRQQAVGHYIVDFYCAECRLVVELDGDSHSERQTYDQVRSDWLQAQGYAVVRYQNTDVFDNLTNLLEDLLNLCETRTTRQAERTPHPNPLPQVERGQCT